MRYFIIFIGVMIFQSTEIRAQMHYKVRKNVEAAQCGTTGECSSICCNMMNFNLSEGEILYYEENSCDSELFKTLSNYNEKCFTIKKDDIGYFFGKVRPKYFYIETSVSVDGNIGNSSISSMLNAFITYYKPIKRLNKDHWFIGGIRTGIAYGVVLVDTDSSLNGQSLLKLFKTEAVFGNYNKKNETIISFAIGISPLNFRDGQRIDQIYPHVSANFSYLINTKNGRNVLKQNKER